MPLHFLWLSLQKRIGPVAIKRLLEYFSSPRDIYEADYEELTNVKGIGKSTAALLVKSRCLQEAAAVLERCQKHNIKILTCLDAGYPEALHKIPRAPALLYYSGTFPRSGGVVLVGSRKCSAYGKKVVCEAASYLAGRDVPVISGMAAGIDGYAHTACLKAGGYTMAFLGGGVDTVYPSEHWQLREEIAAAGTLVSCFPPGTPAHPGRFPSRNFLMAAWADTLLLVEAGKQSGALLTANYGIALGKKVMAVPGSIYSRQSVGTNAMLNRGVEAYCNPNQLTANDILLSGIEEKGSLVINAGAEQIIGDHKKEENLPKNATCDQGPGLLSVTSRNGSSVENRILQLLEDSSLSMDQLALHFKKDRLSFLEALTMLEIEGLLERLPGGMISLVSRGQTPL